MTPMLLVHTIEQLRETLDDASQITLVPTMGALHDGHLSLMELAKDLTPQGKVVASIFVNPLQFSPDEDLEKYPRSLDEDVAKLESQGLVDVLFAPSASEMYPKGFRTTIIPGEISTILEGETRPTHFAGVATVVTKLFEITGCDTAVFGEKDYQQIAVLRQVIEDLNLSVHIVSAPIVREETGLALSSRNRYLLDTEKHEAVRISQALFSAADQGSQGADTVLSTARSALSDMDIDYIELRSVDLSPNPLHGEARLLAAVRVGSTRLIDNVPVDLA